MLPTKAFTNKMLVLFVLQFHFSECSSEVWNKTRRHRQKRALYFTFYGGYALDVLLSVPLDTSDSNTAFCAFVFSANFYYPSFDYVNGLIPIPFTYINEPGVNNGSKNRIDLPPAYRQFSDDRADRVEKPVDGDNKDSVNRFNIKNKQQSQKRTAGKPESKPRKVRTLLKNYFMSRRRFYKMLETKMDSSGFKGNDCLLRAICESSQAPFGYHNGVIGSVLDVLFLPSASKDEKLPKKYYRAEENGIAQNCAMYSKTCPKSIFDYVSDVI